LKKFFILMITLSIVMVSITEISADSYQNYVYDHNGQAQAEHQAVIPDSVITGITLGTGSFKNPQDIFVSKDGRIFIADTGNNRILVVNEKFELLKTITGFINTDENNKQDSFKEPTGIFVTNDNNLYIADSQNARIVVLDNSDKLVKIFGKPRTPLIDETFLYVPLKIAVDSAKRLNIVAKSEEKGIIRLEDDGSFIGFVGAIPTPPNFLNSLIKLFGTKEMKAGMVLNIATVYANISSDADDS